MKPKRIQLQRRKGWRLPDGAVVVARPSRWGNPFPVGAPGLQWHGRVRGGGVLNYGLGGDAWEDLPVEGCGLTPLQAVALYRCALEAILTDLPGDLAEDLADVAENRALVESLRGHDLACWCPLDQPCHADVLLEVANR